MTSLLRVEKVTKRFGQVTVLDRVDLEVQAKQIHALVGANGAGKSTLCNVLAGLLQPSEGSVWLDGQRFTPTDKRAAERAGVQIVQQELNLVRSLSVAENLFLTRLPHRLGVLNWRRLHKEARQLLDQFGMRDIDTRAQVGSLGVGKQQMLEIAASLSRECKLLILDEPTAALSAAESQRLFVWLKELRESGVGIVYISHRLDEVLRLCDRITVLRDGRVATVVHPRRVSSDDLVGAMTGIPASKPARPFQSFARKSVALELEHVCSDAVSGVSCKIHHGERLGLAGLVGSGRTELLRSIFGAEAGAEGRVRLHGQVSRRLFRSPQEAIQERLALVTEDRKEDGLLLSQSVRFNTSLAALAERFSTRSGRVKQRDERRAVTKMCQQLMLKHESIEQPVGTLSGGNQQKVAIGKWLTRGAEILLLDEPTRGIDVGARQQIYSLFEKMAEEGKALLIVSSDAAELLATCDRIGVMSNGRLVATLGREDDAWNEETLMQAAFAGYSGCSGYSPRSTPSN